MSYPHPMELTTCLWFDGRAREAAVFYTSIFPDSSLSDNWIAPTDTPGNKQGEEIVVNFTLNGPVCQLSPLALRDGD
jgi:predicted 3-demethylubiquinone-9 3-methyltransferase (glyoxalase superfamily)